LITILTDLIGGQRREVIGQIQIKNLHHDFEQRLFIQIDKEKRDRTHTNQIPIPKVYYIFVIIYFTHIFLL
jgi:hypothetical protein